MNYSTGFLFNLVMSRIVLIQKQRPEWQAGKYNGVGGKMEAGETPHDTMVREFREETGLVIPTWNRFCTLVCGLDHTVTFFYAVSADYDRVRSLTDENVHVWDVSRALSDPNTIPNLHWLIPMALSFSRGEKAAEFTVAELYHEGKQR